jgi:hypothetical protein
LEGSAYLVRDSDGSQHIESHNENHRQIRGKHWIFAIAIIQRYGVRVVLRQHILVPTKSRRRHYIEKLGEQGKEKGRDWRLGMRIRFKFQKQIAEYAEAYADSCLEEIQH